MHHVRRPQAATLATVPAFPETRPHPARGRPIDLATARIAVVHDWCPKFRGGERVLAQICRQFPQAEVFTLFDFLPAQIKERHFAGTRFHVSAANRLPLVHRYYRSLFFLCPVLIEQFDVTGYDIVISSSAAFARGVITRPDQPHLCYVHSPTRYAWDEQFSYLADAGLGYGPKGLLFRYLLHKLRMWDARTAHGPDVMLANSSFVRSRIRRVYGRDAQVVFPPVDTDAFAPVAKGEHYVTACYPAPYKRTDLVIKAFNAMPNRRLVVVGEGEHARQFRAMAGPNVTFAGYLDDAAYARMIGTARAMVFAGCEDFGIALAEAQAAGTPLVAFQRGGAADIVRPLGETEAPTGVLFAHQTVDAIVEAVTTFERDAAAITPQACRANGQRFSPARFDTALREALDAVCAFHGMDTRPLEDNRHAHAEARLVGS